MFKNKYIYALAIIIYSFCLAGSPLLAQDNSRFDQAKIDSVAKELGIPSQILEQSLSHAPSGSKGTITINGKKINIETLLKEGEESIPFGTVEQKPSFNGGDINDFTKWVNSHIETNRAQGDVILSFTIGADGGVKDVSVLIGKDTELAKEAVRVVSNSPKWEPGRQNGLPVNVTLMYPVKLPPSQSSSMSAVTSSDARPQANTRQNGVISV